MIFEFPAILLLVLEHKYISRCSISHSNWAFPKIFFTFVSITSRSFKIIYWFCHNLKFKFCCQSCDVIFPPKTVKIEKTKTIGFFGTKTSTILQSLSWKEYKMRKYSSKDALLGVLYAHYTDCSTFASSGILPISLND